MEIFAIIIYCIGTLADWYTTKRLLLDKEAAEELNPVVNWMVKVLEKPGKADMVDLGFQKMHKAEIALLLFKIAVGFGTYFLGAGMLTAGIILCVVAGHNKWGYLNFILVPVVKAIRKLLGK